MSFCNTNRETKPLKTICGMRSLAIWLARWVDFEGDYTFIFLNKLADMLGLELLEL